MNRSRTLDILRTVAIVLVLGRHMDPCPETSSRLLSSLSYYWRQGGWVGVDIFFVLSGFLVSGLLFKERQRYGVFSVRNFLLRRGFKIYPAFYAFIFATAIFNAVVRKSLDVPAFVHEIFFVQNYLGGLWMHTWSLAVEEHFYLLLPTLFYFVERRRDPLTSEPFVWLPRFFVVVAVACLAMRLYMVLNRPFDYLTCVFPTHLRIDSLLFGVMISYWYHYRREQLLGIVERFRTPLLIGGIAAFIPAFLFPLEKTPLLPALGPVLFYLGAGAVLTALIGWEPKATPLVNLVAFIGSRSYSVYLWHMAVEIGAKAIVRRVGPQETNWPLYFIVYFIGAAVVGIVMAAVVEVPFLKIRDRLFPSRSQKTAA